MDYVELLVRTRWRIRIEGHEPEVGLKDTLIAALAKKKDEIKDLTVVSNNVGSGEMGLGMSLYNLELWCSKTCLSRQAALLRPD